MAFALLLSFLLALTVSVALYSSRELFTELKELQPISNDSCAPTINISRARTLIPARVLTPLTKEPFKTAPESSIGEPRFWLTRSLESNPPS